MRQLIFVICLSLLAACGQASTPEDSLVGTWIVDIDEMGVEGGPDSFGDMEFTFTETTLTIREAGNVVDQATYTVEPSDDGKLLMKLVEADGDVEETLLSVEDGRIRIDDGFVTVILMRKE